MKNVLFIAISALLPFVSAAQKSTAQREIEQINGTYERLVQLRLELDYVMYATHSSTKAIDRQQAVFSRSGEASLYRLGSVETLTASGFRIAADHEGKELIVAKAPPRATVQQLGTDLSMLLQACDSASVSYPVPGECLIRLDLAAFEVERAELRFDAMSKMLRKVTLFYREASDWEEGKPETKARMEITYRWQDPKPKFAKDLLAVERFVRKVNGAFAPATAFQGYALLDNTRF